MSNIIQEIVIPEIPEFHWVDILIFGIYLCIVAGMGIFFGWNSRKKATTKEFLMGGAELPFFPVALSMMASFLSAIFILGTPAEMYFYGTTYAYLCLSYFTAIPIAAHLYLPMYSRIGVTSAYEYLELRFNHATRIAASLTFTLMVLLYLSVCLYTPAIALAQVTGLSMVGSILATGIVCTFYTALGGMKATVWNDAIQMTVVFICVLLMIILGLIDVGGIEEVWRISREGDRLEWDNFNPDPTVHITFWTQTIGGTFIHTVMYASSQTTIQKFLSVGTVRGGQKACWAAAVTTAVFFVFNVILGLIIYAYYAGCDPYTLERVDQTDQIVPLFVMEVFGDLHGLPGLFIAATFSAALSSISGSLNALAAVFLTDFIKPYRARRGKTVSELAGNLTSRGIATFCGLLVMGMSFVAEYMGDTVLQIALGIFGFVGGPLLATISLGMFMPCINTAGALSGLIVSLTVCIWIAIGNILYGPSAPMKPMETDGCDFINVTLNDTTTQPWLSSTWLSADDDDDWVLWVYEISHMWYGLVALIVAFVVAFPVSIITGWKKKQEVDPKLIYSCADNCCCYYPEPCKSCLRCGVAKLEEAEEDEPITNEDAEEGPSYENTAYVHYKADEKSDLQHNGGIFPAVMPFDEHINKDMHDTKF